MKIVGIQEMKGVSKKTGKPYDSVVLYVTGEAKDVVGCITDNIWVPREVWMFTRRMTVEASCSLLT